MKNKTVTIVLTEEEASHLWDIFAILRTKFTFKKASDLKLISLVQGKLTEAGERLKKR